MSVSSRSWLVFPTPCYCWVANSTHVAGRLSSRECIGPGRVKGDEKSVSECSREALILLSPAEYPDLHLYQKGRQGGPIFADGREEERVGLTHKVEEFVNEEGHDASS